MERLADIVDQVPEAGAQMPIDFLPPFQGR